MWNEIEMVEQINKLIDEGKEDEESEGNKMKRWYV